MEGLFSLTSCIMSPLIDDPYNKNSMKYLDFEKTNILQNNLQVYSQKNHLEKFLPLVQPLIISPEAVLIVWIQTNQLDPTIITQCF